MGVALTSFRAKVFQQSPSSRYRIFDKSQGMHKFTISAAFGIIGMKYFESNFDFPCFPFQDLIWSFFIQSSFNFS